MLYLKEVQNLFASRKKSDTNKKYKIVQQREKIAYLR